jgi:Undecaprenyl-phosphate galactose phosphotransferase WbaP
LAKDLKIQYAIIAMPGASNERLTEVIEKYGHAFPHLLVIPDLIEFPFQNSPGRDLGGVLSLSVRQELLLPRPRMIKRTADLLLTAIGGTLILPLLAVIAVLVKFSSPGSILYTQMRMGKNGTRFKAYKFRTMYGDGEARLQELLEKNPALKAEYEVFHKLQADPRVTPIGRILRKYSLDEFPQLWNVLRGEMSLVGPRPYLEREVPKMDEKESIILKCVPGITGMWQVSARNGAPFSHRINMDVHYVRNWSVWFDAYILASTLRVVVRGTGA